MVELVGDTDRGSAAGWLSDAIGARDLGGGRKPVPSAVIVGINNNPFYYSLYEGAAAAGREMGVTVTWNGAE